MEFIENVAFPFVANARFSMSTTYQRENGEVEKGVVLSSKQVEEAIRAKGQDEKLVIVDRTDTELIVEISGTMYGSYGVKSFTEARKIGEV